MRKTIAIAACLLLGACGSTLSFRECRLSPDLIAAKPVPKPIEVRDYTDEETEVLLLETKAEEIRHVVEHNELSAEYERECL